MKGIIKWFYWDIKNDFVASGYFAGMLFCYCLIEVFQGKWEVSIVILLEMFLTTYVLTIMQKLILDHEKEYSKQAFLVRGSIVSTVSIVTIFVVSRIFSWFEGMPYWAEIVIYIWLILCYLTAWFIVKLGKKYDTVELNEQLDTFKKRNIVERDNK
ncbi:MAG TPA: hypothetical protein VHP81_06215 [Lachnospiraceae bacterium]|nr:hypothetical protein [Lachnospiraceae bacterium]